MEHHPTIWSFWCSGCCFAGAAGFGCLQSILFEEDSIVGKSEPIVFSFEYDEHGRVVSYCKNHGKPIRHNPKGRWRYNKTSDIFSFGGSHLVRRLNDNELLYHLWFDIVNMPMSVANHYIDSISVEYDDHWKRITNIDFSNPNGWICTGFEKEASEFRVSSIVEHYPSFVVLDTFGYAHGDKDLPRMITQKRVLPNGFSQIITYKISYINVEQPDSYYYDTLQYRIPYLNGYLPGRYHIEDNPDECEV